jgi:peptidoglycan/xylan/chitin deacetylase (PgdA/CDA1 family)
MPWPGGAKAAVSLTFDLDADVGECWRHLSNRLTSQSEARYGAGRGLDRLSELLARHDVAATFYVPGEIAIMYPDKVRDLAARGHEIGHHGFFHLANDQVREVEQRNEILRGVEAIEQAIGIRPVGYRSPGWELTPCTLELLVEQSFRYDSSCMGDDRPYQLSHDGHSILELPVHWSLDDWVFFRFTRDGGGILSDPDALLNTWKREVLSAIAEQRHVTFTMHPEVMGRGYRSHVLDEFVRWLKDHGNVWIANHAQIVRQLSI